MFVFAIDNARRHIGISGNVFYDYDFLDMFAKLVIRFEAAKESLDYLKDLVRCYQIPFLNRNNMSYADTLHAHGTTHCFAIRKGWQSPNLYPEKGRAITNASASRKFLIYISWNPLNLNHY